ncbi:hypothetical protein HOY80DRAFT_1078746 [Tuber brumale]|nr:hypothetical protein HOY80DRAFT_1078746 [Tuber brumale]
MTVIKPSPASPMASRAHPQPWNPEGVFAAATTTTVLPQNFLCCPPAGFPLLSSTVTDIQTSTPAPTPTPTPHKLTSTSRHNRPDLQPAVMPHSPHESTPGGYVPTTTATSSGNESTSPQDPTSSPKPSKALSDPSPADPRPLALACPVLGCPLLFRGEKPHGYLKRHLKRPGVYKRAGDQRATWIHLHKIEHDRLVAAGITSAKREPEANSMEAQKVARLDGFELRARNMGITEKASVTQKVTIWEGMYAAKESGDSIDHDAWVLLDFFTNP